MLACEGASIVYYDNRDGSLTPIDHSHRIAPTMTSEMQANRLQGQKVVLREKQLEDAERDYRWATDHELTRLDAAEPYPMPYSTYLMSYPNGIFDSEKKQFAIESLDGIHIGNCTCYNIDRIHKEAEMGILVGDRDYWGKGYGADAVIILMKYIFEYLGMTRIFLHTLEWNIRAQECFKRCGFVPCGHIVRRGQEFIEMEATAIPNHLRNNV